MTAAALTVLCLCARADVPASAETLSQRILSLLQNAQVEDAAQLFHYPDHYSARQRLTDQSHMTQNLADVLQELGPFSQYLPRAYEADQPVIGWELRPGDPWYWAERPLQSELAYPVRFADFGRGRISFLFIRTSGGVQLAGITFAVDADDPAQALAFRQAVLRLLNRRLGRGV